VRLLDVVKYNEAVVVVHLKEVRLGNEADLSKVVVEASLPVEDKVILPVLVAAVEEPQLLKTAHCG